MECFYNRLTCQDLPGWRDGSHKELLNYRDIVDKHMVRENMPRPCRAQFGEINPIQHLLKSLWIETKRERRKSSSREPGSQMSLYSNCTYSLSVCYCLFLTSFFCFLQIHSPILCPLLEAFFDSLCYSYMD